MIRILCIYFLLFQGVWNTKLFCFSMSPIVVMDLDISCAGAVKP